MDPHGSAASFAPKLIAATLRRALDLIRDPARWRNWAGAWDALDTDDQFVSANNPAAVAWSMHGAILCVLNRRETAHDRLEWACWYELYQSSPDMLPEALERSGGHPAVVELMERTIRRLEEAA